MARLWRARSTFIPPEDGQALLLTDSCCDQHIMIIAWFLDPLHFAFIVRALLAAVMVGVVCSVLGTYVVLRGMAFFGDALAHTILPGVVVSFLLGWPLAMGALIMGVLTALGIGALTERGTLKEDTAIGVIFAGLFALGMALLATAITASIWPIFCSATCWAFRRSICGSRWAWGAVLLLLALPSTRNCW